ncbi:ribosomal protein L4 [Schizopora paradoxa]|uniref:Large ribosomal subunit protein uL4m n=1 Tax=Schizopora paradoxa TaxID=27342 RepID=A0A0H2RYA4_9AGAM|nr:ribosomal protein L4 [Schizopora paradoxa]
MLSLARRNISKAVRCLSTQADAPVYLALSNLLPSQNANEEVVALNPSVFAQPIRRDILFLCVNHDRDALRQGSASTKTRGEVAGSGRKIRPQKGTGRARLGDAQSPMLRGGGVAFGPKPRDFATDLPRKVRMLGMRIALSSRVREDALGVTSSLDWPLGAKTGPFANRIARLGWSHTLFLVGSSTGTSQSHIPLTPDEIVRAQQYFDPSAGLPPRLARVTRNIPNVHLMRAEDANVLTLLKWPRVVLDLAAVDYFERLLGLDVPEHLRIPAPPPPLIPLRFSRAIAGRSGKFSPRISDDDQGQDVVESVGERQMFE